MNKDDTLTDFVALAACGVAAIALINWWNASNQIHDLKLKVETMERTMLMLRK